MILNKYQSSAVKTTKKHELLTSHQSAVLDWTLGLCGEAGEVSDIIKHTFFHHEKLDKMELAKEMGDVLWYLAALANECDIKMDDIAELNIAKLNHRYNAGAYNDCASAERHNREFAFKDSPAYQCVKARITKSKHAPLNVIFIGPDGAGKTTIAEELVGLGCGLSYHKCDYRQEHKMKTALSLLETQTNVLYDRFYYPDNLIYSRLKGETVTEEDDILRPKVLSMLSKRNTIFVYVTASKNTLMDRIKARGDDYITDDDIPQIMHLYTEYVQVLRDYDFPVITVHTSETPFRDTIRVLMQTINQARSDFGEGCNG